MRHSKFTKKFIRREQSDCAITVKIGHTSSIGAKSLSIDVSSLVENALKSNLLLKSGVKTIELEIVLDHSGNEDGTYAFKGGNHA